MIFYQIEPQNKTNLFHESVRAERCKLQAHNIRLKAPLRIGTYPALESSAPRVSKREREISRAARAELTEGEIARVCVLYVLISAPRRRGGSAGFTSAASERART